MNEPDIRQKRTKKNEPQNKWKYLACRDGDSDQYLGDGKDSAQEGDSKNLGRGALEQPGSEVDPRNHQSDLEPPLPCVSSSYHLHVPFSIGRIDLRMVPVS